MLTSPRVPSASASFVEESTTVFCIRSVRLNGGYTAIESPLCTPARSTCSMIPGISTFSPSEITSTSSSHPGMYLSISTGFSTLPESISSI